METVSSETSLDPRIVAVISGIGNQIEELNGLPEIVNALENRVAALETQTKKETSGNTSTSKLELKDIRISELESQIAFLESSEFREELILEWLKNLDQDSFYALGVRKGYMEEINQENKPPLGELKDPSPEVIISEEKPADLTGWAYSKTLNC